MKKKIAIIAFLLVLFIYVCYITLLPSNYILVEGETLHVNTLFGIAIQNKESYLYETKQASLNLSNKLQPISKLNLNLSLFNKIPLKEVTVDVIPKTKLVPVGRSVGMKLYTDGVLVVGMSEIEGQKPYAYSDIKEGDRIIEINNNAVTCTADLITNVNNSKGREMQIKLVRDFATITTSIKPAKTDEQEYKIGLWVRDAAAGVGTITFYEPETGMFGALGHGITDVDTSDLIYIANGELITTNIVSITKGEKGKPGEIRGTIETGKKIGNVSKNTEFGIFGNLINKNYLDIRESDAMELALRNEIKEGEAEIICELEDGKRESYKIRIQKVYEANNKDNKSMLLKVTDEKLIEKTGGIIPGMSGSPIIQDGKLVGAVTHVLVNDPTMGYGVFADIMLKQMREN